MSAAVGVDVESICNKCGDVWHVVVAKVGESIAKVQCKECGAYHRYRPPGGKKAPPVRRRGSASSGKRSERKTGQRVDTPRVEPDLSRPARRYRIDETFEPGERVEHPTFGLGVVEGSPGVGKIEVLFPAGRRVLAQARPEPTLKPPPRRPLDAGE